MENIHVLLIEDNYLMIDGITAMLHRHDHFQVIARPKDGDALRQLKTLNVTPEIVLLGQDPENTNNLRLMSLLKEAIPDVKIIAINILPEQVDIIEFVKAGGYGFILNTATPEDWITTIKAVASGEKVLPPIMTHSLFTQILVEKPTSVKETPLNCVQLTLREREVVNLIAEGLSNKEIAEALYITTFTVKSHVHNILEKLKLSTRLEIAAYVRKEDT